MILTLHNVYSFDATAVQKEPGSGFGLLTRVGCTWLCVAVSDWKVTNGGEDTGARTAGPVGGARTTPSRTCRERGREVRRKVRGGNLC